MRIARATAALLVALVALIGVEIMLARRGERIDPFPLEQLNGRVGSGSRDAIRLVWIGDSTGDGVGSSHPDQALPRMVARGLDRPVDLVVLARSGSRVADGVTEQLPQLSELDPDWVVVAIASNDVIHLTRRSVFRRSLDELLEGVARAKPSRVIVLGPGQFAGTPRLAQPLRAIVGLRAAQLNADVRSVARKHDALFVDIIARVGGAFVGDPAEFHASDRFHPSDAGYELWARATLDTIREAGW